MSEISLVKNVMILNIAAVVSESKLSYFIMPDRMWDREKL